MTGPSGDWTGGLRPSPWLHTIGAFAFLTFLIVHIYMATTGHTIFAHIKSHDHRLGTKLEENGENETNNLLIRTTV